MKNFRYSFMVLLGGVMYGTMSSFVRLIYSYGYNAAEIAFSQALLAAIFLGILLFLSSFRGEKTPLSRKGLLSLLLTGGIIGITNFLYYQSVSYISASLAIVILMQFTWFSLLLEWIVFGQRPGKAEAITVIFILIGTVMAGDLLHAKDLSFSWQGILFALASSLTYAVYIVANSRVPKEVKWQSKSTFIMVGSALAIFIVNAKTILVANHFGYDFLGWAIFLAVVGTTIPTALFAVGIPHIGAGTSAILMTIEFPVAVICAHIVLKEAVSPLQIGGIVVMLAAIAAMNYYKSLKTRKEISL
ncbi:Threonine/homoserine efflux transporter RhtA [Chitinophaga sp. YR627]|uniref:EamA family transporter n=1 Tax=Chitinophaga sp. YR627 TaxID=1881041 RepID=UPI0008F2C3D1|nr:DMT family transporter [Chitinophaga sp. YR627]SFM83966.1 Threonine/homoserine efflux transporter RhtA [Chitinophaga sp. YR627]